MVYAFLMTKGGQQVPQPKSKATAQARSREMMSEEAEQTPDVSPPRPPPERPPTVFVRAKRWNPRLLAQKCEYHEKADCRLLGTLRRNDDFLFYVESLFFFCEEILCFALCARMTRAHCFLKKRSMAPFLMTRKKFEALGRTPVQG